MKKKMLLCATGITRYDYIRNKNIRKQTLIANYEKGAFDGMDK